MANEITVEELKSALPKAMQHNATTELVDKINNLAKSDELREVYRDNLISYASVMKDGRFQLSHYINAVRYISHKVMGDTDILAYTKTFPDRIQNFHNNNTSSTDIASYVSSYNKNKLVNLVREQSMIPTYILNADHYQRAINKQVALMDDITVSPAVQQKAADSLLVNLRPPDVSKIELDMSFTQDESIQELREATAILAQKQLELISSKQFSVKAITEKSIIEHKDDDDD